MAPRDKDDYDDRPRRSWAEIDKLRDGKRSAGSAQVDKERDRFQRTTGYSRYKSAADAFFSGNATPEALREKVDPGGEGRARQDTLAKLKKAESEKAFAEAATEYLAKWDVPDDVYLLDRMLGHPKEDVVRKVLEKLQTMLEAGELYPPKSMAPRLRSVELTSDDPDLQDAAKRLGAKIKNLPPRPPPKAPPSGFSLD